MEGTTTAVENTIPGILEGLGQVSDFVIDKMADYIQFTLDHPLLLIPVGFVVTFTVIGIFKRFI